MPSSMLNMLLQQQAETPQQNPLLSADADAPAATMSRDDALNAIHEHANLPRHVSYEPGSVTIGEAPEGAFYSSGGYRSPNGEFDHHMSFLKVGNRIDAVLHDIGEVGEDGPLNRALTAAEEADLKMGGKSALQGQVEDETERARWESLSPAQQKAEQDAEAAEHKKNDDAHTKEIHDHIDALVKNGWRPDVNKFGGWKRPEALQPYQSPKSHDKIEARLKQHGIDLQAETRRARERGK